MQGQQRLDSGITADQGLEGIHYFQSMHLHKDIFGTIFQTNVELITGNFENIGAVVSSKPIEFRKSPSPALVEDILRLGAFKDMK